LFSPQVWYHNQAMLNAWLAEYRVAFV